MSDETVPIPQAVFLPPADDILAELDDEPIDGLGVAPEPVEGGE